jgi:hypothetical protein
MVQTTTTGASAGDLDLEREMDDARAASTTLRPAPVSALPTLSSYADAETLDGVLDRAALRKTPGLYTRAWRIFRANKVAMTALVILTAIVIFVLSAGLISTFTSAPS